LSGRFCPSIWASFCFELGLPVAPAVMVGEEIVVEGESVDEGKVEAVVRRHLGLPEAEPRGKSILSRLFRR